jgi:hypothetical protein
MMVHVVEQNEALSSNPVLQETNKWAKRSSQSSNGAKCLPIALAAFPFHCKYYSGQLRFPDSVDRVGGS